MQDNKKTLLNVLIFTVVAIAGFIWIGNKVLKTSGAK